MTEHQYTLKWSSKDEDQVDSSTNTENTSIPVKSPLKKRVKGNAKEDKELSLREVQTNIPNALNMRADNLVIVMFAFHAVRDVIWQKARDNQMMKEKKLRFTEDLTMMDKMARNKLWSLIEKARKEGLKVGFKEARTFIEGKEVFVET